MLRVSVAWVPKWLIPTAKLTKEQATESEQFVYLNSKMNLNVPGELYYQNLRNIEENLFINDWILNHDID